jgi:uncharacterized protein YciU (UPF0263 family)
MQLKEKKGIIVADIDDTILRSRAEDIGIWKDYKGEKTRLTTEEFAKDPDKGKEGVEYDYWEFGDPEIVRNSIINGTPLLDNLHIIDDYLNKDYHFCFLTARRCEDVITEVMTDFMKTRGKKGELEDIGDKFEKGLSFAINDEKYAEVLGGLTDFERKAKILKIICGMYHDVIFIDDDAKNLRAAEKLGLDNLTIIEAT